MKIFGNRKRTPARRDPAPHADAQPREERPAQPSGRINPFVRAVVLLLTSLAFFVSSIVVCFALIDKSAEPLQLAATEQMPLKYAVAAEPPVSVEAPVPVTAPKSVNDSQRLNILVFSAPSDAQTTDMLLLLTVDMDDADVAMLSIPRDTLVAGNYEQPTLSRVYAENGTRGVQALQEQISAMFGFRADYYFVVDEAAADAALAAIGELTFQTSASLDYSELSSANAPLTGESVMKLLNYRADYTSLDTAPTQTQRELIALLLDSLLANQDAVQETAAALAAAADTDLSADDLTYLGYLLKNSSFSASFSRTLPGDEVEIEDESYYQVDAEEALALINANCNPLAEPLTLFNLNFRQKTGDSTDGEYSPYGFSSNNNDDDDDDDDGDAEPDDPDNPDETTDGDSNEPNSSDEPTVTDPTDASSDTPEPTDDTPAVTDAPTPTDGGTDTPPADPVTPNEPDGSDG